MCAGNDHLLRVGPFIIARRYTYLLFPNQHRAGPDARRNAEMLRQVRGITP
jgi:hypothetical protein